MTTQKLFKRRVRERMTKTGESYTTARAHVSRARERRATDAPLLDSARELASDAKLIEATGRDWEAWIDILDRWGARDHKHPETARYLIDEHGVPGWWAQSITNGYERARGIRQKHQQANGFTIYASKTVGVPLETLFQAFVDDDVRARWLTDGAMSLRNAQTDKVARFDWAGGSTRVMVTFEEKGPSRSTAHVAHERIPDAGTAEVAKSLWKKRVTALKGFLEADR
ncbi:MAG: hypothetical protein M3Y29_05770 [Chloroflexota bacterium]|nr:hypothetical protein [Chloroflexota bacterium]